MPDAPPTPVQRLRAGLEPLARTSPILRALLATDAASRPDLIARFADEAGHRRQIDLPFLAHLLSVPVSPPPLPTGASLDVRLWWAVHDLSIDPIPLIAPRGRPLIGLDTPLVIETASQTELGALHALWTIAQQRRNADLRDRCLNAAEYLIAELQPDNATNHPLALAVFLALADRGNFDAVLYAQTLLHNCQIQLGHPDAFSAALLLHAARWP